MDAMTINQTTDLLSLVGCIISLLIFWALNVWAGSKAIITRGRAMVNYQKEQTGRGMQIYARFVMYTVAGRRSRASAELENCEHGEGQKTDPAFS
jgi:hypothetical protein